ncbi:MAG: AAA family ATPase [Pseudomonadota bacterium]|nr:AAA family ATPase [Pseudomonadota bacterium]
MLVRKLEIENFRKFRRPVTLTGFADGLNLVCEPNEIGKSTVLEALRAVLFERHGAKGRKIQSFRPHGDEVAPTVALSFEVAGEEWSLQKRFLQSPMVALEGPSGRFQSDAAEEKLQALLGFARAGNAGSDDDTRGALGLLWIEQGKSFELAAPGEAARRTFEEVLAGEIGAVTGGRRTAAVLQAIDKAIAELLTPTGKPAKRLKEASDRREQAQTDAQEAQTDLEAFEGVLTTLEAKRAELRRVLRDLDDPDQKAALASIRADIELAKTADKDLKTARLTLQAALLARERFDAIGAQRQADRKALASAEKDLGERDQAVADQTGVCDAAREAEQFAAQSLSTAREALTAAETARSQALADQLAAERSRATIAAFDRLDRAEILAKDVGDLQTQVDTEKMTAANSERLEVLDRTVLNARSVVAAGAPLLEIELVAGAQGVTLDGAAVEGPVTIEITQAQELAVEHVGVFRIRPAASGEGALAALRAAEQDLAVLLANVGHATAAEARAAARLREDRVREIKGLNNRLAAECPADTVLKVSAGLAALRAALREESRPAPDSADSAKLHALATAGEDTYQQARAKEAGADATRGAALTALQAAELLLTRLTGEANLAKAEVDRLQKLIAAAVTALSDESLGHDLAEARADEARAVLAHNAAKDTAEGLDFPGLERRLQTHERRINNLSDARVELAGVLGRLEAEAKTLGSVGPASRAQAAAELTLAAEQDFERLNEEAEVLALLRRTLEEARLEASRKYLAPIAQRIEPYVRRLLPNASLSFTEDFRPSLLTRSGREEAADDLSKGTQEQLAVLTRLAFADLLLSKGKPASLLLDDALVFADDERFETMTEILTEAAQRMQVIILSCRASAYRHVDAQRILLT